MITSVALQNKINELLAQKEQKIADINAINGAIEAYNSILQALKSEDNIEVVNEDAPVVINQ